MLGIFLREIVVIMMLITLNTLPFVSTVASPICSRVVSMYMDKRPDDPTQNGGNNKWTKGGRCDGLIGAMNMGFN